MDRKRGPYFVNGESVAFTKEKDNSDIIDFNRPPTGQPGLWCNWEVTEEGKYIQWNDMEKFYNDAEWMSYIIQHFLKPDAIAKKELPFLQCNHTLNGKIFCQGEDYDDTSFIIVEDNNVSRRKAIIQPIGGPIILSKENVISNKIDIYKEMAIESKLTLTGQTTEDEEKINRINRFHIRVPAEFRGKNEWFNEVPLILGAVNENMMILFNEEAPIIESIYLVFESLFNKNSPLYNHELDIGHIILDGIIEIKNNYCYSDNDFKDVFAIVVIENQLFLHKGELAIE